MSGEQITTGFERLAPAAARWVLAIFAVATLFLVGVTLSPLRSGFADAPERGAGDIQLYQAEVARIHAGQSYYEAAAAELAARGYPTRSVFNWRTPLLGWILAKLPAPAMGRVALALLAGISLLAACCRLARDSDSPRIEAAADRLKPGLQRGLARGTDSPGIGGTFFWGLLLFGALLPCALDGLYVLHELWAGVLIFLSVLAYGFKRSDWGAAAALAALAVRELAAPYCVLCAVLAVVEGRRRETLMWLLGAAAYGATYAAHMAAVLPHTTPDAAIQVGRWFSFGGAGFVISAVQVNGFLLLLPQWVSAVYLALALVGFAGWQAAWGRRAGLTAAIYLGAMAVVGQPVNQYWGAILAPLLCLGVAQAPAALASLWQASRPALEYSLQAETGS